MDEDMCSGQRIERVPSERELSFMNNDAIPMLDSVSDDSILEKLSETFWNLCIWEKDRASALDTKAASLLGLSSIAAAVVAVSAGTPSQSIPSLLIIRCISVGFFTLTVAACIYTLLVRLYGSFNDYDVIAAIKTHDKPLGNVNPFSDKDPKRCFLKETILQRWLIYRWYSDINDCKFKRLRAAQFMALASVLSLLVYIILFLSYSSSC